MSIYTDNQKWQLSLAAYSDFCQMFKIESFAKIVSSFKALTFFVKCFILDVWQSSEYANVHVFPVFNFTLKGLISEIYGNSKFSKVSSFLHIS